MYAVDLAASGETIGAAGLQHLEGGPEIEVGYRLLKGHWGQGYATECARASIACGFDELGLDRIVAVALPENTASRRVLEKCGLHEIGLVHAYGLEHVKYEIAR
jgi:[ribosomal protein S5]-alanine N-acetyltransferase